MKTNLGNYVRARRTAQGLTLGQLAREVGYQNTSKGVRRLSALENSGIGRPALLEAVVRALELDSNIVGALSLADRDQYVREWNKWADEPVRPHLVERLIPGVCRERQIPDEHLDDPQAFAQLYAAQNRRRVCLVASRRLSIWVDENGAVEGKTSARPEIANQPFMELRGRAFVFADSNTDGR